MQRATKLVHQPIITKHKLSRAPMHARERGIDIFYHSLLGFLLVTLDDFIDSELALLDGDENVGILSSRGNEFSNDKLSVFASSHAEGLEALKTVLIINLELLEGEASVLNEVTEEGSVLHGLDGVLILREVLNGNTCQS